MPEEICLTDVGPRDGLQNIKEFVPTETKLKLIDAIADSGVKEIEITSFVHPKAVPQMADAMEIAQTVLLKNERRFKVLALVPNLRWAENAAKCGITNVSYVISASAAHNLKNINRTVDESLEDMRNLISTMSQMSVRLNIATAFGCPFEGDITVESVMKIVKKSLEFGVKEITLCDTIGIANPKQVIELAHIVQEEAKSVPIGLHMHDTRGMGLANMLAGMISGVTKFDTSVGGLGGCPFAPDSAGNTASEDAINMIHEMGIATGIDLSKFMEAVKIVKNEIQPNVSGHLGSVSCYADL